MAEKRFGLDKRKFVLLFVAVLAIIAVSMIAADGPAPAAPAVPTAQESNAALLALNSPDAIAAMKPEDIKTNLETLGKSDNQDVLNQRKEIINSMKTKDVLRVANIDADSKLMQNSEFSKRFGTECQKDVSILNKDENSVAAKNFLKTKGITDNRNLKSDPSGGRGGIYKYDETTGSIETLGGIKVNTNSLEGKSLTLDEMGFLNVDSTNTKIESGTLNRISTKLGSPPTLDISGKDARNPAEVYVDSKKPATITGTNMRISERTAIGEPERAINFDSKGGTYAINSEDKKIITPESGGQVTIQERTAKTNTLYRGKYNFDEKTVLKTTGTVTTAPTEYDSETILGAGKGELFDAKGKSAGKFETKSDIGFRSPKEVTSEANSLKTLSTTTIKGGAIETKPFIGVDENGKVTALLNQQGLDVSITTNGNGAQIYGANAEASYKIIGKNGGEYSIKNGVLTSAPSAGKLREDVFVQSVGGDGTVSSTTGNYHPLTGHSSRRMEYTTTSAKGSTTIQQFGPAKVTPEEIEIKEVEIADNFDSLMAEVDKELEATIAELEKIMPPENFAKLKGLLADIEGLDINVEGLDLSEASRATLESIIGEEAAVQPPVVERTEPKVTPAMINARFDRIHNNIQKEWGGWTWGGPSAQEATQLVGQINSLATAVSQIYATSSPGPEKGKAGSQLRSLQADCERICLKASYSKQKCYWDSAKNQCINP